MTVTDSPLRKWRLSQGYSLEDLSELFGRHGFEKPSTAKLSRIERDQDIPLEMIGAVETVTGIPAKEQRPDIAKIFGEAS